MDAPAITRRRFTTDEYEQIVAAGVFAEDDRVELVDGEIIEMSPLGPRHSACVDRLTDLLVPLVKGLAIVRVQSPIRLSKRSEPQPDVTLLQWRSDYYANGHPEPEDVLLLLEVADSSLTYDRDVKLPLYARAGIPEVWLVALLQQSVTLYREPGEEGYGFVKRLRCGETLSSLALPAVQMGVNDILG
jgi:Uma2 family endonuclease